MPVLQKNLLLLCSFFFTISLFAQELVLEEKGELLPIDYFQGRKGSTRTLQTDKGTYVYHLTEKKLLAYLLNSNNKLEQTTTFNLPTDFRYAEYLGGLQDESGQVLFFKKGKKILGMLVDFEKRSFEIEDYGKLWKGQLYKGSIADQENIYLITQVRKTKSLQLHAFDAQLNYKNYSLALDLMPSYVNGRAVDQPIYDRKRATAKGFNRLMKVNTIEAVTDFKPTPVSHVTAPAKMYLTEEDLLITVETGARRTTLLRWNRDTGAKRLDFIDYPDVQDFVSNLKNKSNSFYSDGLLYYVLGNEENAAFAAMDLSDYKQLFQTTFNQNEEVEDYYLEDLEVPEEDQKENSGKELKLKRTLRRIFRSSQTGIKVIETADRRYIALGGYTFVQGGAMMMPGVGGVGGAAPAMTMTFTPSFERAFSINLVMNKKSGQKELKEFEEPFNGMSRYLEDVKSRWDFRFIHEGKYMLGYFDKKSETLQFREFKLR